ncbi:MAG: hypothetical protein RQ760_10700 [Sedimentisphaerales bacterium]|nr:hypothetical protein [Sedimentisphaerales bacterium]
MWDEEKDFEILDKVEEHDLHDDNSDDYLYPELDLDDKEDENEDSDIFDYEAGFYYDEEDD